MSARVSPSRRHHRALKILVACAAVTGRAWAADITDTFTGTGTPSNLWLNPANWSTDAVPNNNGSNLYIATIPANLTVLLGDSGGFSAASDTVFDLDLTGPTTLDVDIPLTVTDAINGSGATINVSGTTLSLAAQTATAANPANISVTSAGLASLAYSTLTFNNGGTTLSASGTGSTLDLHTVGTLSYGLVSNGGNFQYDISASNNGTVNLSGLTNIVSTSPFQNLNFITTTGGTINLNGLQTIDTTNVSSNFFGQVTFSGASFSMPALTTAELTLFNLASGQSISAPKLTNINTTEVEVAGGSTFTTGNISDIDSTEIFVTAGGVFGQGTSPITATTINLPGGSTTLSADGTGSILNLSSVKTLTYGDDSNGGNFQYNVSATNGGTVNLSGLTNIVSTAPFQNLNFTTSGTSAITLTNLQTIDTTNVGSNFFGQVTFNGSFSMPALTTAELTLFDLKSGQSINAPKLTNINTTEVEVAGGSTFTTGNISDIDSTEIFITAGGVFGQGTSPITATTINLPGGSTTLSADGTGSILNLSSVKTLTYGDDSNGGNFQYNISATNGGTVNLSGLTNIVSTAPYQNLNFTTTGTSAITLTNLQTIDTTNVGSNFFGAVTFSGSFSMPALTTAELALFNLASGQSISAPKLTNIANTEVKVAGGSTFTTGNISDIDNTEIFVTAGGVFGQGTSPITATSLNLPSGSTTLSADGTGSILNLSSVKTLTYGDDSNGGNFQYNISATNGGTVNLSGLTNIVSTAPYQNLNFTTAGTSAITLTNLQTIDTTNVGSNFFGAVTFSGSFSMPALTTAELALFNLTSGQSISAPKLTNIANTEVKVAGGSTFTTGNITDIDDTEIFVTSGGVFGQGTSPITATTLNLPSGSTTLSADGTGSILNLSSVNTLTYGDISNGGNFQYDISATNGGTVNLSGLTNIVSTAPYQNLNFTTTGTSAITLTNLQTIDTTNVGSNFFGAVTFNGSFSMPALTTAELALFNLASGQSISAPKLTNIANTEVKVAGGSTFTTGNITDIDDTEIFITSGGVFGQGTSPITATTLNLPSGSTTLSADGTGSILNLSSVNTLTYGDISNGGNFQYDISATNGGTVNLSGLTNIVSTAPYQNLNFTTSGTSAITLTNLQTVDTTNVGSNFYGAVTFSGSFSMPALTTAELALFNLAAGQSISAPKLTNINNTEVKVAGGSTFTTGNLSDIDNAEIFVTSGAEFGEAAGSDPITATSITINGGGLTLSADGTGSVLDLHTAQTIYYGTPSNGGNFQYTASATDSGTVNLSGLINVVRDSIYQTVNFNAATSGTINLTSLQNINMDTQGAAQNGTQTVFALATNGIINVGGPKVGEVLQTRYTAFDVNDATGKLTFLSHLSLGVGSSVNFATGSTITAKGNFINTLASPAAFQASGAILDMNGLGVQTLEAAGTDAGAVSPGNNGNFGFGQLDIGTTANAFPTEVDLVDNFNNGDRGSGGATPEALYLFGTGGQNGLVLNNGSVLVLGSLNAYEMQSGSWLSLQSLFGSGQTIVPFTLNGSSGYIAKNLSTLQDSWINSGSGSWTTASNWSLDSVPGDLNDALITTSTALTVTGPSATSRVRSITVNGPASGADTVLTLPGAGTLTVNTAVQIDAKGQVNLTGGTLISQQLNDQGNFTQSAGSTYNVGAITNTGVLNNAGNLNVTLALTNNANYAQTGGTATFGQILGTGKLTLTSGLAMLDAGGGTSQIGSFSISGTGHLDLVNNSLDINYTGSSPEAQVQSSLESGYNDGAWNGTGIISSAAATTRGEFALGYADGSLDAGTPALPDQVLIKYALVGDANLDGTVNLTDLLALLNSYGQTGKDWVAGDFNYDGTINLTDLLGLLNNYGEDVPQTVFAASVGGSGGSLLTSSSDAVAVPEPATAGLLAIGSAGLLTRRRRSRRVASQR